MILASPESRAEADVVGGAVESGRTVFTIDFAHGADRDTLLRVLGQEFLFPYDARNFDVALDLLSDLAWFGNDDGYLVVLRNIDRLQLVGHELFENFVDMVPYLCDRWRSGRTPFDVLILVDDETRLPVRALLAAANAAIDRSREKPWLRDAYPAPIVEHDD